MHNFDVDPGRREFAGALHLRFDSASTGGFMDLGLLPDTALSAHRTPIKDAVNRSGLDADLRATIVRYIDDHAPPVLPDAAFHGAARQALFTNGDLGGTGG